MLTDYFVLLDVVSETFYFTCIFPLFFFLSSLNISLIFCVIPVAIVEIYLLCVDDPHFWSFTAKQFQWHSRITVLTSILNRTIQRVQGGGVLEGTE
jgi:type IV secretory pathway VirB3-like protein